MSINSQVHELIVPESSAADQSQIRAWFGRVRKRFRDERAAAQLRALDDRMLADIGLTRTDIPSRSWWFPAG